MKFKTLVISILCYVYALLIVWDDVLVINIMYDKFSIILKKCLFVIMIN